MGNVVLHFAASVDFWVDTLGAWRNLTLQRKQSSFDDPIPFAVNLRFCIPLGSSYTSKSWKQASDVIFPPQSQEDILQTYLLSVESMA